jgi:hypothetical protein
MYQKFLHLIYQLFSPIELFPEAINISRVKPIGPPFARPNQSGLFFVGIFEKWCLCLKPKTLSQLKNNIESEIKKISVETLINVSNNMVKRVRLCLANNGHHFQHLL